MLSVVPELGTMYDSDRDTYAQFVAFTSPIQAGNSFVLGQSGFIQMGSGGTPVISPALTNMLDLYRGFQYKPMPITHSAGPAKPSGSLPTDASRLLSIDRITQEPTTRSMHIEFATGGEGAVQLDVYDVMGRKVARLLDRSLPAGRHAADWKYDNARSAIYFVRCESRGQRAVSRLFVAR